MPGPIASTLFYLINVIFGLYIIAVVLRLFLQKYNAPFHNPIVQLIVKLTKPVVKPLQKIVPGVKGFDLAIVVLLLVIEMIKVALVVGVKLATFPDVGGWILWAVAAGIGDIADIFFWGIIIGAVLTWIPSMQNSALAEVIYYLTAPFLSLFQRIIPPIAGIDFSPLVAIVVIRVLTMLLLGPFLDFSVAMALS